jgi:hypothetical protein
MTNNEIAMMAERICKARDADPADAKAMLHAISYQHGHAVAGAVVEMCRTISQRRCEEVSRIFAGLSHDISFADALRIKREQHDPCAQGWTKQSDGTYSKLARC